MIKRFLLAASIICLLGCKGPAAPDAPQVQMDHALEVFEALSSDAMAGRKPGTDGHEKARGYIGQQLLLSGLFDEVGERQFPVEIKNKDDEVVQSFEGRNLYGLINADPDNSKPLLVITAHYDHLGTHDSKIYNGADDNASGCAALFAIAKSFETAPPDHDVLFVWLDVEESGLRGAFALIEDDKLIGGRSVVNLNLDMISQNEKEIYLAGGYHTPKIKKLLKNAAHGTGIKLKFGHDRPEDKGQDWTLLSDHGAFHKAGIPFAYFGVEDHAHYHKHTDDFETIPLAFYKGSVQTVVNAAHLLEENLESLARPAKN